MIHPKTALALAAIAAFPVFAIFSKENFMSHNGRWQISTKTNASGYSEQNTASWNLNKTTDTKNLQLRVGDSTTVNYILETSTTPGNLNTQGVKGEVCIKNKGKTTTENLKIQNQVQYKIFGFSKNLDSAQQISYPPQIKAGEETCTPFNITFSPPQNQSRFRLKTTVSTTNGSLKQNEEKTTSESDEFKIPRALQTTTPTATLTDSINCPQNYSCTPTDTGPWNITTPTNINLSVLIKNISASCDLATSLKNTGELTNDSTKETTSSTAEVPINTGPC